MRTMVGSVHLKEKKKQVGIFQKDEKLDTELPFEEQASTSPSSPNEYILFSNCFCFVCEEQ